MNIKKLKTIKESIAKYCSTKRLLVIMALSALVFLGLGQARWFTTSFLVRGFTKLMVDYVPMPWGGILTSALSNVQLVSSCVYHNAFLHIVYVFIMVPLWAFCLVVMINNRYKKDVFENKYKPSNFGSINVGLILGCLFIVCCYVSAVNRYLDNCASQANANFVIIYIVILFNFFIMLPVAFYQKLFDVEIFGKKRRKR